MSRGNWGARKEEVKAMRCSGDTCSANTLGETCNAVRGGTHMPILATSTNSHSKSFVEIE